MPNKESQRAKAAYPPTKEGLPSRCKKGGIAMVTYTDLFQFCLLLVALVGLCYTIFGGKK